ncbi:polysaccharide export protein [Novosphingobium umbonatum]|uniref:Polysaccharide export protein n=1 Tax=Novosphingobium umbonatum TaxID=1908524 RepID=A0A437N4Y4_9SPHN|nr:polysaccharide biosynthesis/export family protein [Novosphingobium umbonatum]RVU04973.1 polysaccharide export protein [Novosphingobium umbonatum]
MSNRGSRSLTLLAGLLISSVASAQSVTVPSGASAYQTIPVQVEGVKQGAIQSGDRLYIRVVGEPDLTSEQYWVDGGGTVQVPMAGDLMAGGRTTGELAQDIADRLASRYIRNPVVAVSIVQHAQSSVTVEGDVQKAGRFEATPNLTLLGALALAQSTTRTAKLDQVMVFRNLNGQRLAARFNLKQIRRGLAADPQIIAGDVVVVGRSPGRALWTDLLQTAPLFNIFYILR